MVAVKSVKSTESPMERIRPNCEVHSVKGRKVCSALEKGVEEELIPNACAI